MGRILINELLIMELNFGKLIQIIKNIFIYLLWTLMKQLVKYLKKWMIICINF